MHLPKGYILLNRYRIEEILGQGGFGKTYLVFDELLKHHYCIKELFVKGSSIRDNNFRVHTESVGGLSFSDFKWRFMREAQELARFDHPGIVRVTNVFEANNTAYYVMEYVRGETLKAMIKRAGPFKREKAIAVMHQLLDAVEAVHNSGKLHRDIKPDNVLVSDFDRIVLIDFGSARDFSEGSDDTHTAMVSNGYAPIEQYSSRAKRTKASDIYAVGATMYFMLTGQKPLDATDRVNQDLPAPHELNSSLDSQISSVVMLAMQMRHQDRFQSVNDFRDALFTVVGAKEGVSDVPLVGSRKSRRTERVLVVLALLIILASTFFFLYEEGYIQTDTNSGSIASIPVETEDIVSGSIETDSSQYTGIESQEPLVEIKEDIEKEVLKEVHVDPETKSKQIEPEVTQLFSSSSISDFSAAITELMENMVYVEGGAFEMGCTGEQGDECHSDEKPVQRTTLNGFWINKYEVTQGLWEAVMGANPSLYKGCDYCPVENISWDDAQAFIRELNRQTGKSFRLPTEEEWEFAARGGNNSMGFRFAGSNRIEQIAWFKNNSKGRARAVGQLLPNELGLYDMSGNVWEWCSNAYKDRYGSDGATSKSLRVIRGGTWNHSPRNCRVARRFALTTKVSSPMYGLRLAHSP